MKSKQHVLDEQNNHYETFYVQFNIKQTFTIYQIISAQKEKNEQILKLDSSQKSQCMYL